MTMMIDLLPLLEEEGEEEEEEEEKPFAPLVSPSKRTLAGRRTSSLDAMPIGPLLGPW